MARWPMKIAFFCVKAAQQGGETPLLDCREVCRRLDPDTLKQFAEKGVMYIRNFSPGLDVSWHGAGTVSLTEGGPVGGPHRCRAPRTDDGARHRPRSGVDRPRP